MQMAKRFEALSDLVESRLNAPSPLSQLNSLSLSLPRDFQEPSYLSRLERCRSKSFRLHFTYVPVLFILQHAHHNLSSGEDAIGLSHLAYVEHGQHTFVST
jgi:hypothetical protein